MSPEHAREQPCAMCHRPPPSEAHHATFGRGLGQKADDSLCIPLCLWCHRDFHAAAGRFRSMDKAARRAWQEAHVSDPWDDIF